MSKQDGPKPPSYRINLKLDRERDATLIDWVESQPRGERSEAIREMLRVGLGIAQAGSSPVSLDKIRQIVADELARVLTRVRLSPNEISDIEQRDIEDEFGEKLDKMLGQFR